MAFDWIANPHSHWLGEIMDTSLSDFNVLSWYRLNNSIVADSLVTKGQDVHEFRYCVHPAL